MKRFALIALTVALTLGVAYAQTPPPAPPFAGGPQPSQTTTTQPSTAPRTTTAAPVSSSGMSAVPQQAKISDTSTFSLSKPVLATQPSQVLARPDSLMSDPQLKDLAVSKVRVRGTASSKPVSGGARVDINWSSVTLDDGSKSAVIAAPLQSSMISGQPVVPEQQQLKAKGDTQALIDAIKQVLQPQQDTSSASATKTEEKKKSTTTATQTATSSGAGRSAPESSSTPTTAQGAYKPLDLSSASASKSQDTSSSVSQVCPPRVDMANLQVFEQSKTLTTTNGVMTESQCLDSKFPKPIQWDYQACNNTWDISSMLVHVYRKPFYIDSSGASKDVGSCQESVSEAIQMKTEKENCPIKVDLTAKTATEQAEVVYYDKNGKRNVVQQCGTTGSATSFTITETTDGCSIRNDFTTGKSFVQSRLYYVVNGIEQTVRSCTDTATSYTHVPDSTLCKPIVDKATKKYYQTASIRIDTPNGSQYISNCQPTNANGEDITETFAGCETQHRDDFSAQTTYLFSRWKLTTTGAYVTDCTESLHNVTQEFVVTGWQNDDATRQATQLLAVYAQLPDPAGRTMIDGPSVRSQSTTQPYSLQSIADVPDGTSSYPGNGCNAYRNTVKSEVYARPDTTTYTYAIGAGTPTGPVDVCVENVADSRQMETGLQLYTPVATGSSVCGVAQEAQCEWWNYGDSPPTCTRWGLPTYREYYNRMAWSATVNKYNKKNVETGTVVTTYCGFANNVWKASAALQGQYCSIAGGTFPQIGAIDTRNGVTYNTVGENTGTKDYQRLGSGATLATCPF